LKTKILFVCTGNTCRSILAQELLQKMAKEANLELSVSSAGTSAFEDAHIPIHIFRGLREEGIAEVKPQPKRLTQQMVKEADLILGMEDHHIQQILSLSPQAKNKVFLVKRYACLPGQGGIPDPIGSSWEGYETCLLEIKQALLRIVERLKNEDCSGL
jgi:protein-tyrosine-phosphatase